MKCIDLSLRLGYSALGCQCRLNKGGTLFRRTRYQQGSLVLEERKRGSAVWVYRWWEKDINGKPVRRKLQIGSLEQYPTESVAQAAADALRLTINNPSNRRNLRQTTVNILWEQDRKSTRLNSSHSQISYAVFCLKKKKHTLHVYESKNKNTHQTLIYASPHIIQLLRLSSLKSLYSRPHAHSQSYTNPQSACHLSI